MFGLNLYNLYGMFKFLYSMVKSVYIYSMYGRESCLFLYYLYFYKLFFQKNFLMNKLMSQIVNYLNQKYR